MPGRKKRNNKNGERLLPTKLTKHLRKIMSENELNINEENDFDEISAHPNDVTASYSIVPNSLIRDASISPQCRWLIIYLLSNKPGWKIKTSQLKNHTKGFIGRDGIRNIMNEAIEAGYIKREVLLRTTPRGKLRGYCYFVSSTPVFKKVLRETENQGPDDQGPEDTATKEILSKELLSLSNNSSLKVPDLPTPTANAESAKASEAEVLNSPKPKRIRTPSEFSPMVKQVADQMINALVLHKPNYIPPRNLAGFLTHVDYLLRLDKRDPILALDVFTWALSDPFWADKMYKPNPAEYLRKQFDQLEMKMNAKPPQKDRKFAPSSNDDKAYEIMKDMSSRAII